jgi:hypothetical protein
LRFVSDVNSVATVLALNSRRWRELRDAYGPATEIPTILRRIADGDHRAIWHLYDAFALVSPRVVPGAAIAAVPHLWAAAAPLELDEQLELFRILGRIAYCAVGATVDEEDLLAASERAFRACCTAAIGRLPEVDDETGAALVEAILAFNECSVCHDAFEAFDGGAYEITCPSEMCGVTLSLEPTPDGAIARVDELSAPIDLGELADHDPAASWSEGDAFARLVRLLEATRNPSLADRVARLAGRSRCAKCGEPFDVLEQILNPTEI